jgi:threonyl-tRNA synthetase
MKVGKRPSLPLWLAPTQVRVIPVSQDYLEAANKAVAEIESAKIRVDVDNREETVGKKIRDSEKEWIPYTIVIGEKETGKEKLPVRIRETGKLVEYSTDDLASEIKHIVGDKPWRSLPLPKYLQARPKFSN